MTDVLRRIAVVAALALIAVVLRAKFVDALTRTTGTWIGSPQPAKRAR